jgi:hypothetical protein
VHADKTPLLLRSWAPPAEEDSYAAPDELEPGGAAAAEDGGPGQAPAGSRAANPFLEDGSGTPGSIAGGAAQPLPGWQAVYCLSGLALARHYDEEALEALAGLLPALPPSSHPHVAWALAALNFQGPAAARALSWLAYRCGGRQGWGWGGRCRGCARLWRWPAGLVLAHDASCLLSTLCPLPASPRRAQEQLASGALPRRHLPLLAWAFAAAGLQQPAAWEALSSALLRLQGGALAGALDRSGLTQLYQAHLAQAASPSPLYLPAAGLQAASAAYLGWASRASFSEAQVLEVVR